MQDYDDKQLSQIKINCDDCIYKGLYICHKYPKGCRHFADEITPELVINLELDLSCGKHKEDITERVYKSSYPELVAWWDDLMIYHSV